MEERNCIVSPLKACLFHVLIASVRVSGSNFLQIVNLWEKKPVEGSNIAADSVAPSEKQINLISLRGDLFTDAG